MHLYYVMRLNYDIYGIIREVLNDASRSDEKQTSKCLREAITTANNGTKPIRLN